MKPLIAIVGNTGVGKSQFAVELAKVLNGEIINGDAMQMYNGLDIITNKHPESERGGIPHHLLGCEPWKSQLTVQDFEDSATKIVEEIHDRGKVPILVGGTHYYIQSLVAQNALIRTNHTEANSLNKPFTDKQLQILNDPKAVEAELKAVDPIIAAKFHPNDTRRLRRALEIWYETGQRPSDIYASQKSGSESQRLRLRYNLLVFWVWCGRTELTERLDSRVLDMVDKGLRDEISDMYKSYTPDLNQKGIWQVIGFKEFLPYLETPNSENWAKGVAAMQSETRRYAKQQTKWIRNKLAPLIESIGGSFAVVDSSDLTSWDSEVKDRGTKIAAEWLKGVVPTEPLVPENLASEVTRKRPAFDESQWSRHKCEECSVSRGTDVTIIGEDEWRVHLQSKAHRAIKAKAQKKNE